ncbi:hypothetical protein F2P44_19120 [Massilia sp. CCM 8695]|uniref:TonB C-terminal domain-containing protein n=1 Tax=Massilia frigida TaxID=2609281 RepID=A0ABX0NDN1_9BURK|nr:hypothetical protein [Massilia frigida]NHZ81371.1 hypothetical protein [Massilia frigida]
MNLRLRPARLLASFFLSMTALAASAAATPDTGQFLQILEKQVGSDGNDQSSVTGLIADAHGQQFASAILARLAEQKAYRDDMQAWLSANAEPTQEDLVRSWLKHYHRTMFYSHEVMDDQDMSVLFRMGTMNPVYGTPRQGCQTRSEAETHALLDDRRHALIEEHKDRLARVIAAAYVRGLANSNAPSEDDKSASKIRSSRVMAAFQRLSASLPAADAAILANHYAYKGRLATSMQEACDNAWVISHAIVDAKVSDAVLLRNSVTQSAYAGQFESREPVTLQRVSGFTSGKAMVTVPTLLTMRQVVGTVSLTVTVDQAGKVSEVAVTRSNLVPERVTSANGESFEAAGLFQAALAKYYRAGQFAPRLVDGAAAPFSFSQEFNFK